MVNVLENNLVERVLEEVVKEVLEGILKGVLEAVLEAYYLQWIAQCSAAQNGDEDQIPPTDDPFKDYYRIKTYAAITNHINQYPETNPDDWNELSNEVMKEIPEDPEQWTSLQNYEISNS